MGLAGLLNGKTRSHTNGASVAARSGKDRRGDGQHLPFRQRPPGRGGWAPDPLLRWSRGIKAISPPPTSASPAGESVGACEATGKIWFKSSFAFGECALDMTSDIGEFPESRTGNPYSNRPDLGSRYSALAPSRLGQPCRPVPLGRLHAPPHNAVLAGRVRAQMVFVSIVTQSCSRTETRKAATPRRARADRRQGGGRGPRG